MQISYSGIQALKMEEGFRADAYPDGGGTWTIGYGTINVDDKPVQRGMHCTPQEAEIWLMQGLAKAQTAINQACGNIITQHQFDALCSFAYNEGVGAFQNSTMLRKIKARDYKGAAAEFDKWVYIGTTVSPGLVARRKRERCMFEG